MLCVFAVCIFVYGDVARREGKRRRTIAATLNRVCSFSRSGHHDCCASLLSPLLSRVIIIISPLTQLLSLLLSLSSLPRRRILRSIAKTRSSGVRTTVCRREPCVRRASRHAFNCGDRANVCVHIIIHGCRSFVLSRLPNVTRASFVFFSPRTSFPFDFFRISIFPSSVHARVPVCHPLFVLFFARIAQRP